MTATTVSREGSAAERQPHPSPIATGYPAGPSGSGCSVRRSHGACRSSLTLASQATPAIRMTFRSLRPSGRSSAPSRSRSKPSPSSSASPPGWSRSPTGGRAATKSPATRINCLGMATGATRFIAMAGILTSLLFLIGIALAALNLVGGTALRRVTLMTYRRCSPLAANALRPQCQGFSWPPSRC